jgi:hypothetical protein
MKKRLLTLLIVTLFGASSAFAQCTPDPQFTQPGVYPDSATNFMPAYVNQAYSQLVTNVVPVDTTVEIIPGFPQTLSMDSIVVDNVTGLPPGFTYQCVPNGCAFLGGTSGCMIITGTPNPGDEGNYPIQVDLSAYVGGTGIPAPFDVDYYFIDVLPALSVTELNDDFFAVKQNQPNPFSKNTTITYSMGKSTYVTFTVYNLLGKVVREEKLAASRGDNNITVNAEDLGPGVYMYSLKTKTQTITKRMVVNR